MKIPRRIDNRKGFTLIELMIVIAIIGILAAIAVPNFMAYKEKGYDAQSNADIKNAYTAAQSYFADYASGALSQADLIAYGFKSTPSVTLTITNNTQSGLAMEASHTSGTKNFTVDATGAITF